MSLAPFSPSVFEDPRMLVVGRMARGILWHLLTHAKRSRSTMIPFVPGSGGAWTIGFLTREVGEVDFESAVTPIVADLVKRGLLAINNAAGTIEVPAEPDVIDSPHSLPQPVAVPHEPAIAAPSRPEKSPRERRPKPVDCELEGRRVNRNTVRAMHSLFGARRKPFDGVAVGVTWEAWLRVAEGAVWLDRMAAEHARKHPLAAPAPSAPTPRVSVPPVDIAQTPRSDGAGGRAIEPAELMTVLHSRVRTNGTARRLLIRVEDPRGLVRLQAVLVDWRARFGWGIETYQVWGDFLEAGGMDWRRAQFSPSNISTEPAHFEAEVRKALDWHASGRGAVNVATSARAVTPTVRARALPTADAYEQDPLSAEV